MFLLPDAVNLKSSSSSISFQNDLYHTIGVASEMGASGVVIWGNRNDENTSPEVCHKINAYIQTTLGPYIANTRQTVRTSIVEIYLFYAH